MSSDSERREGRHNSRAASLLMVNTPASLHAGMTKILTLAIFHQIIKIIVWPKTKPDLFHTLTL